MFKFRKNNNQDTASTSQNPAKEYYLDFISRVALPSLQEGNFEYASVLQRVFTLDYAKDQKIAVANAYVHLLSQKTVKQLLNIEENFRYYPNFYEWREIDMWKPLWENTNMSRTHLQHLSDKQYQAVLKFGTFHANGYCRQICMTELSSYEDTLFFFILRMNDWVEVIREKAFLFSCDRLKLCDMHELVSAMPALDKLRNSGRRKVEYLGQIEQLISQNITAKAQALETDQVHTYDISIKNAIYRFVNRNPVLSLDAMETLLFREKQSYGKRLLILGILNHYNCDSEKMEIYLKNKSSIVRYETLVYRYYTVTKEPWASLTELLMDKIRKIRLEAGYILEKHQILNVLDHYKQQVNLLSSGDLLCSRNSLTANALAIAIFGIGEHGLDSDIELVSPYLEHEDERLVKAAFLAYTNLLAEKGSALYLKYLLDDRPGICKQAFLAIRKYEIHYGPKILYNEYLQQENEQRKNYILKLLCSEPSTWGRLPYLLQLLGNETISKDHEELLRASIAQRSMGMGAHISQEEAQKIRDLLEGLSKVRPYITETNWYTRHSLKEKIEFELRFVAREQ